METIHGYELTGEWKNSTSGKIAKATKGGKRYFLKKYQTPVAPINNGTLDAKTFENNRRKFDDFVNRHKQVNNLIRPLAGAGGNIVIPSEEFMDGNQLVEASEFVEGVVPKEELIPTLLSLDFATKLLLMKTAAGAMSSVHSKHVIHSDLKLENFLLVRNERGNYVAKLLDFDSSYPADNKPEEIIGTIDYYSPELGEYGDCEEDDGTMRDRITEKTDIFSLGLIYHFYLSGKFPEAVSLNERLQKRKDKGKIIYPWVALSSGCELQLDPCIKSPKFIALLSDMLSRYPEDRPTAAEVLRRLQQPDTDSTEPLVQEPHPSHGIILDKNKIKTAGIIVLDKTMDGSEGKYKALFRDGKKKILSKDEMISAGYAKIAAPAGYEEPWPEHGITFDQDKLKSRGFISCKRATKGGINGYDFYRADGSSMFFRKEMLVSMKFVTGAGGSPASTGGIGRTTPPVRPPEPVVVTSAEASDPWPEHHIEFDMDAIKSKGYVAVSQKELNGIKGYEFIRANGTRQFIRVEIVVIQKMAKKI